jgi:MFS family permease
MSLKIAASLLGQRRFLPLMSAQALGAFNDNLFRYALVTLATYQGLSVFGLDRGLMVPIAATMLTLPIFLFSGVAGQVADRYDRTKIMRFAKFAEIFLMIGAAAGFLLNQPLILLGVLFLMGTQSAFFAPARNSALPTLLTGRELVSGNAMVSGSLNIAILIGAGLGTVLAVQGVTLGDQAMSGPAAISAILVTIAVIGWIVMRQGSPAPASNPDLKIEWNIAAVTWRILRFAATMPAVLRPLLGAAWFWMLAASIITLMPLFALEVLSADESVVLLFTVIFTLGAALGAVACGLLSRGEDALAFTIAGAIGLVIFPVDIALQTAGRTPGELVDAVTFASDSANWRILIDLGLSAISAGLFVVPLQAMAQHRAPAEYRGRLLAAGGILNAAAATLGQFSLAGIGIFSLPLQSAFLAIALVSAGAAAFAIWRLMRRNQKQL